MPTPSGKSGTLLIFSPVAVPDPASDSLALPRKHLDGITAFADLWQGPLTLVLPKADKRTDNLDSIAVERAKLPFDVRAYPGNSADLLDLLQTATVVLAPVISLYIQLPALCAKCGVPLVVDADLTPAVRADIVLTENSNLLLRWRRLLWLRRLESSLTAMVRAARGIHLLGPEAYAYYAPLNPAPLLYFDTRVRRAMMPTAEQTQMRAERLRAGAPLRLVYSGRWRQMKGVLDLPRVAAELRRLGVQAEWDIFGGGVLESELKRAITKAGLDNVRVRGKVPFPELMQFVAARSDLFVCCHRQGDPSTTFIEMLSFGVPLVGYDTGGLRGIVSWSRAGWLTPRNNVTALAAQLAQLDHDRNALAAASVQAVEFTRDKSFEDMMQQRVGHLRTMTACLAEPNGTEGQSV